MSIRSLSATEIRVYLRTHANGSLCSHTASDLPVLTLGLIAHLRAKKARPIVMDHLLAGYGDDSAESSSDHASEEVHRDAYAQQQHQATPSARFFGGLVGRLCVVACRQWVLGESTLLPTSPTRKTRKRRRPGLSKSWPNITRRSNARRSRGGRPQVPPPPRMASHYSVCQAHQCAAR